MPRIEFMKTYHYWEDDKIYKAGEILDVDYDHYRELIDTGIAKPYVKPPIKAPVIIAGTTLVEYIKSTPEHKCGDIVTVTTEEAFLLGLKGIVKEYVKPPIKAPTIVSGTCCVQVIKSTPEYKCGDIVVMDNEQAFLLERKGVVIPATQECAKTQACKHIYKINIAKLLALLKMHNVTLMSSTLVSIYSSGFCRIIVFMLQTLISEGEIKPEEILIMSPSPDGIEGYLYEKYK